MLMVSCVRYIFISKHKLVIEKVFIYRNAETLTLFIGCHEFVFYGEMGLLCDHALDNTKSK
jgi:hypothetical protein